MIDYGFLDRPGRRVTLREVGDENWREVADIAPLDDQRSHAPAMAARYLLLSMREDTWNSLAVHADDTVVGHVMWGLDDEDGSHWIGGMLIDGAEQGKGLGLGRHLADVVLGTTEAPTGSYVDRTRAARSSDESYDPRREGELWNSVERFTAAHAA
ncbi:hypothetical protein [Streptomyces sp. NBC_01358]|uniref:hypothetical protein n=1 Tax=Streptomyces sp. NBC_01358 TaxID=2903837 RepID=UPI002E32AE71|nr:hypothetical protein [Streptomyces sp. NBC_01358]